ncbi:MAG: carboxylesterase/lipase family protein [Pseudomonadota bacterium]|nr:carboxylesterase/lipase family protein [Pseudomonadota bacterium]
MKNINRRTFTRQALAAAALLGLGRSARLFAQDQRLAKPGATVKTTTGSVRGLVREDVQQFWNLPYGASTAGANRFMPPQPVQPWSGVRDHFSIGTRCWQQPGVGEPAPVVLAMNRLEEESEDCLRLNVFTPTADNGARPVMVWLHGGGFTSGSGNYLIYDGTLLAKKEDVVVVSVTHRLNIFGFLHLADLGGAEWAGATNAGMQDIVAALQWVRDNIAAFGGDPQRVTIFGQSGGGSKVTTLMAMPSASGLYHRAIAQSGAALRGVPASDASAATERFLAKLGIGTNQLRRLHGLTPQEIQQALYSEPVIQNFAGGPVIDGAVIPRHQWDPSAPEFSADVPLMAGSTATENGWLGPPPYDMEDGDMQAQFTRLANGDAAKGGELLALYHRIYPNVRNRVLWLIAESDNTRRRNAQVLNVLKHAQATAPSWLYYFDWHSPVDGNRMGAYHTLDIPFVFNNVDVAASMTGAAQERYQLAHVMSAAWAAFARSGNPDHADMPHWPAFDPGTYPTMVFASETGLRNDPNREEREALEALGTVVRGGA